MNLQPTLDLGSTARGAGTSITGFIAAASGNANASSVEVTAGEGWQIGDLLLAAVTAGSVAVNTPAGWTMVQSVNGYALLSRTHDGSANYTFTLASTTQVAATICAYRGFTLGASSAWSAGAVDPTPASITPPVADSVNVYFVGAANTDTSYTVPSGFTARSTLNLSRSLSVFERDALVAASALAGVAVVRAAGSAVGRALQLSLSPAT